MPYYIFKVQQDKSSADLISEWEKFPAASDQAKNYRRTLPVAENCFIKVIYAANPEEGARLILEKRQPSSPVEEWE